MRGSLLRDSISSVRRLGININVGSLDGSDIYDSFYNPATRRLIQVTTEGIDYMMGLVESIDARKKLLYDKGILSNPYGFNDL